MHITILYFGPAADDAGVPRETLEAPDGSSVADFHELLDRAHPALVRRRSHLRFAVNAEYADASRVLREGDEVAVIPPVAGG